MAFLKIGSCELVIHNISENINISVLSVPLNVLYEIHVMVK